MGRFHIWPISWCPVSIYGIKLPCRILKLRKQKLTPHKPPVTSLFGSREKRGNEFLWASSHRDPPLGQTGLLSTRAWVQAGKMLSASRLNVFGKPERGRKQLHATDSRECGKNVFCTLGKQCHHPDTLNCQLQTEKQNVQVRVASLSAGNHHQKGPAADWDQWQKQEFYRQTDLPPIQLALFLQQLPHPGLSSPSLGFLLCTLIATWHIIYWLSSLPPVSA